MGNGKLNSLKEQIIKVIKMLEAEYNQNSSNMLELILKRYQDALSILQNKKISEIKKEDFHIVGSVRAFLESTSDYQNPVLEEMHKAEKLLEEIIK